MLPCIRHSWRAFCLVLIWNVASAAAGKSASFRLGRTELGQSDWYKAGQDPVKAEWRYPVPEASSDERVRKILESIPAADRNEVKRRCEGTRGEWCYAYLAQQPITWRPQPKGQKPCEYGCNKIGRCDYDTGSCRCTAGWTGRDCHERQPRYCDQNVGFCFCNNGTYGRQHDLLGLPFTATPDGIGRPISWHLQPGRSLPDARGQMTRLYAGARAHQIWGERGWCEAKRPSKHAPCHLEAFGGAECQLATETTCVNQCGGHGDCHLGFCMCDEGWYGDDCTRQVEGAKAGPARTARHLRRHIRTPVLDHALTGSPAQRKRPLIYVYDIDTLYTSKMLQWRHIKESCVSRFYGVGNITYQIFSSYMLEFALHEMILQSEHLTRNPEEADFFFVPVYESCFAWPIHGYTEFPYFFENGVSRGPGMGWTDGRTVNGMYMYQAALRWIRETFPFWDRKGGRDHIIMATHDEGSCWLPNAFRNATLLTHWAPLDFPRPSHSAWPSDIYSYKWPTRKASQYKTGEHLQHLFGSPCFDPSKDICVVGYKPVYTYKSSPLLGQPALKRDVLLFLRGDVGKHRLKSYSNGVRQKLYECWVKEKWKKKYNILIGDSSDIGGAYSQLLARSVFCVIATGDGFSMRAEDAMLHGCIPVVIMDNILPILDPHLDWDAFSVRIAERDIPRAPQILQEIQDAGHVEALQRNVARVWKRFTYSSYFPFDQDIRVMRDRGRQLAASQQSNLSLPLPEFGDVRTDDAFETVMAILYGKLASS